MTRTEEEHILSRIEDVYRMTKDIWISLKQGDPNDDVKDFTMNVLANLAANKVEHYAQNFDEK